MDRFNHYRPRICRFGPAHPGGRGGQGNAASRWGGKFKTVSQIVAVMAYILGISWAGLVMNVAIVITVISGVDYFLKAQDVLKSSME